jgi:hypothetical protein
MGVTVVFHCSANTVYGAVVCPICPLCFPFLDVFHSYNSDIITKNQKELNI